MTRRSTGGIVMGFVGSFPALLVGLTLPGALAGCAEECDGTAIITGRLLGPDGEPVSQGLVFAPTGAPVDPGVDQQGDREAHATSFTVTTGGDGRFSVTVEPGQWSIDGRWRGDPPKGDRCDVWAVVFAEYCGEHDLTLEFDCQRVD